MDRKPACDHESDTLTSQTSNTGSPMKVNGIHIFRMIANMAVVLFHTLLYWSVMEGATLPDTLKVLSISLHAHACCCMKHKNRHADHQRQQDAKNICNF